VRDIRFVLVGLGNIGRNLMDILVQREARIASDCGMRFVLVGAADSSGAAIHTGGLDMALLRDIKLARRGAASYPQHGRPTMSALEMIRLAQADMLMEASPTNLQHGEPGLSGIRGALGKGWHVVTANKGPLVLAFGELTQQAAQARRNLLFSGTVAGGLPVINMGMRDLVGSGVTRVEGIFNGTTNYILCRMEQEHIPYAEALAGAQQAGIAEADPTLDVDGWDAANKLVIVANAVLHKPATLQDVSVEGIRAITLEQLLQARQAGQALRLIALAEQRGNDYVLSVRPTRLPAEHPLARTGQWDMGVVYYTDYMGVISAVIEEKGPVPTSAAVLRDMINACRAS
jgi:homoserine dehydrogenase